jgi:TRAP-type C4-dicarboxylate transport system permease small subunit
MTDAVKKIIGKTKLVFLFTCGASATVIMFINAVCRYVFKFSFVWAEELIRIIFVWSMFVAITESFFLNEHIGFTGLTDKNKTAQRVSRLLYAVTRFAVGFILAVLGWKYERVTGAIRLTGTNLPMGIFMWPGIGAGVIWTVLGFVRIIKEIRSFFVSPDKEV